MATLHALTGWVQRAAAMVQHPRRLASYLGVRAGYRLRLTKPPCLPVRLEIEPNNNCNLRCEHCQVTHWSKATTHLTPEAFRRIIDQFPALSSVKLQGMGEPLLNKRLTEILTIAEARGVATHFVTNGTVYTKKIAEALDALRLTTIAVSIDGASAEVFEDIRAGARFASFVENVTDLARRRAGSARTRVSGWSVLTRRNLHEAPAIVRLARAMNITTLTFQPFLTHWGKDDMRARIDPVRIDPSDPAVKAVLDEALRVAQEEGVALRVGKDAPFSRESPCTWPWLSAYITSTGDVVPCCLLADADTMKMGNLFETPFREIWRGEPYQTLRRQIANNAPPRSCRGCYGEASTRQETLVQIKARP